MKRYLKTEDSWAILIGIGLLVMTTSLMVLNKPDGWQRLDELEPGINTENNYPFKTTKWYQLVDEQQNVRGSSTEVGKWMSSPIESFILTEIQARRNQEKLKKTLFKAKEQEKHFLVIAQRSENESKVRQFQDERLNIQSEAAISEWRRVHDEVRRLEKKYKQQAFNQFSFLGTLLVLFLVLFGVSHHVLGVSFKRFVPAFLGVFLLSVLAFVIGAHQVIKAYGLGYAFWAILIGLLISNTLSTPNWLKPALSTEFYVKTGLVLLGAEVLIGKVAAIGLPGVFVAWVVTPIVLLSTYWFGQRVLKIPSKTLNITICADMSVCGVSAAVATAAACKAKKEELTLAVGLSMIFTSVMMIVMPMFIRSVGMSDILGGAWIGGTLDATGAVVAAGAFLGDRALSVAATIKMIQNILIGIIAFSVAVYFSRSESTTNDVGWKEIFKRFPRFILGFISMSIVFSVLYEVLGDAKAYALIDQGVIVSFSKNIRSWCFCLAFLSIGLSTNFKQFGPFIKDGKPFILYLCGQTFNILLTLLVAYLMFFIAFPEVTGKI